MAASVSANDEKVDYYELLGVPRDASPETIKKRYRASAKAHHPDKHVGKPADVQEAEAKRFRALSEAYDILSHPEKRQHYDTFGHTGLNSSAAAVYEDIFDAMYGGGTVKARTPPGRPGGSLYVDAGGSFFQVRYGDEIEWQKANDVAKHERLCADEPVLEGNGAYHGTSSSPSGRWELLMLEADVEGCVLTVTLCAAENQDDVHWEEVRGELRATRTFSLPKDADLSMANVAVEGGKVSVQVPKFVLAADRAEREMGTAQAAASTAPADEAGALPPTGPAQSDSGLKKDFFASAEKKKRKGTKAMCGTTGITRSVPMAHKENGMSTINTEK